MSQKKNIENKNAAQGNPPLSRFAYAACSTPPGSSGIAVIRMSGKDSFIIADEIFRAVSPEYKSVSEMPGYSCAYGKIYAEDNGNATVDFVVLTKFISPESYTGEDTVEISCHGGTGIKKIILETLFSKGARPAEPGEFTRNAFINGKIDLSQAEAVMDLINSTAKKSGLAAARQLEGGLSSRLGEISRKLYNQMSKVEMIIEFPEHEESSQAMEEILAALYEIKSDISNLIDSYKKGRILREGFSVVIAGKPNAGKSSMLNTISGHERSIVTDIPGTTRDTVEETVDIDGIPVRLIDTAGIRSSDDAVEKLGIERARETMKNADLVFWISSDEEIDTKTLSREDEDFRYLVSEENKDKIVLITGKSDILPWEKNVESLKSVFPESEIIPFSSVTREGLEKVFSVIREKYESLGSGASEEVIITNQRHYNSLGMAYGSVSMAIETIESKIPADILAVTLRSTADRLSEITGDEVSEELVNEIFSRFCIGK